MEKHLNANPESGKNFYQNFHDKGKIVMLNLLKFREKADYTNLEQLQPNKEICGEEAYLLYMEKTLPELKKAGSRILYYGKSKDFLIGPEAEKWDAILLVEHESVVKFIEFAQNKDYLKNAGHRTAGLEDSRLLPSTEIKTTPNIDQS
ncbi:DUF1330 domain-containing protein [Arenibacter palladensis]|uniref:DUF1330 domain-containing protein n=1 Tax=Arenibacter palladensis TaxID=237373 RepID=UPI0026E1756D|nr:DUF1330 domain-containing protein [Arenibacter palladensis]MDO6602463.1 DUF1330 domain-containing protein [Arenibacter palladensis]|tara:strand:+ start:12729 stop:13172 length:444 start_codon:yes stop_codon:yes gene_type:complete